MAITPKQVENARQKEFNDRCKNLEVALDTALESGKIMMTISENDSAVVEYVKTRFERAGWNVKVTITTTSNWRFSPKGK